MRFAPEIGCMAAREICTNYARKRERRFVSMPTAGAQNVSHAKENVTFWKYFAWLCGCSGKSMGTIQTEKEVNTLTSQEQEQREERHWIR